MSRIIIHNPTNYSTKTYRYYNIFFDLLVDTLQQTYEIIQNRYYIDANKQRFPVKLLSDDTAHESSLGLLECEMILENYDTKQLKILSVSDFLTEATLKLFNTESYKPFVSTVLISQFDRAGLCSHVHDQNTQNIYKPWIYFPSNLYDFDRFYYERQKLSLIDKFYFRGSGLEHRPLIQLFDSKLFFGGKPIGNFDMYASEAISYKVGFSCAGSAQFCYRDIEYMAMGIPMLRFKYHNEMNPNLIPNYHYISVEPSLDKDQEHQLNQTHASMIEQRFLQVKDDVEFLSFIANNARQYYCNYIHGNQAIKHTINLLELDEWN